MKSLLLITIGITAFSLPGFCQLSSIHNHLRAGDVLIKQQVEYKDPGNSGPNRLWDFSKLKSVNNEYTLTYNTPPLDGDSVYILGNNCFDMEGIKDNELIVGTEHNTMYYYRFTNDSLLQLGHENPSVILDYTNPVTHLVFPLNYGQAVTSSYQTKGLYSGTVDISTRGDLITKADAYGKLVLPSGDTLSPVLRVRTEQTIYDSQVENISHNGKQLETCKWYTKGYRYPVFETVRNINRSDSTEIFATAFFFPPQDHLYLDTDPDNQALLDELWDMDKKQPQEDNTAKTVTLQDIMSCKMYPNPVESILNLEYELKEDARVSFELYSLDGMPVKKIAAKSKSKGMYYETLDCSSLYPKNYVLRITANGAFVNEIIIKK
jgi:hypothetical protein